MPSEHCRKTWHERDNCKGFPCRKAEPLRDRQKVKQASLSREGQALDSEQRAPGQCVLESHAASEAAGGTLVGAQCLMGLKLSISESFVKEKELVPQTYNQSS